MRVAPLTRSSDRPEAGPGSKIGEGGSLRAPLERVLFRWPRRIGGGIAGSMPTRRSARAGLAAGPLKSAAAPAASTSADARGADLRDPGNDGWGPRLVAGATGHPHRTVWKVLWRARPFAPDPRPARASPTATSGPARAICCTWTSAPTRASGGPASRDRRSLPARQALDAPETRVGNDYAHAIVDDHSRLAYVELHDDERAATVTGFSRAPRLLRQPRHHARAS
jgi:hypothetical protein